MKMDDNLPILANKFLAALAEPKKGIAGYRSGKYAESKRRSLQADIATSQKFVVSNNLVEHAYLASLSKPKHLVQMLDRGTPPFNNMWIEWNEEFRAKIIARECKRMGIFEEYNELYPEKVGENPPVDSLKTRGGTGRVGYHIQKINSGYLFEVYCGYENDELYGDTILSSPMGFFIGGTELDWADKLNAAKDDKEREEITSHLFYQNSALLGQSYFRENLASGEITPDEAYLLTSLSIAKGSAINWLVPQHIQERGLSELTTEQVDEMVEASLMASQGDARFLIALLGLLNYDLVVHETVKPPKRIDHIRYGRVIPKNEYKVVTIDLPKPRGKRIYERMFTGHGSPKREHWRRGHWRTLKDASGVIKKRVWIDEMKVGNSALGSIIHDYDLQAKKPQVINFEDINNEQKTDTQRR
tara:strand:- start:9687 stop:10934 length:1248 start_codon:yes stop_codon:yes gene_type:complete